MADVHAALEDEGGAALEDARERLDGREAHVAVAHYTCRPAALHLQAGDPIYRPAPLHLQAGDPTPAGWPLHLQTSGPTPARCCPLHLHVSGVADVHEALEDEGGAALEDARERLHPEK